MWSRAAMISKSNSLSAARVAHCVLCCRYVALWIFLSATVIMYNKWVLSFSGFPYPVALTLWHMFFCSALAFGVIKLGYVESINMSSETYLK